MKVYFVRNTTHILLKQGASCKEQKDRNRDKVLNYLYNVISIITPP